MIRKLFGPWAYCTAFAAAIGYLTAAPLVDRVGVATLITILFTGLIFIMHLYGFKRAITWVAVALSAPCFYGILSQILPVVPHMPYMPFMYTVLCLALPTILVSGKSDQDNAKKVQLRRANLAAQLRDLCCDICSKQSDKEAAAEMMRTPYGVFEDLVQVSGDIKRIPPKTTSSLAAHRRMLDFAQNLHVAVDPIFYKALEAAELLLKPNPKGLADVQMIVHQIDGILPE